MEQNTMSADNNDNKAVIFCEKRKLFQLGKIITQCSQVWSHSLERNNGPFANTECWINVSRYNGKHCYWNVFRLYRRWWALCVWPRGDMTWEACIVNMPLFVICLVPRHHYCARPMRIGSRCTSGLICQRNALTEKAWEDAVQGLGELLVVLIVKRLFPQFLNTGTNVWLGVTK